MPSSDGSMSMPIAFNCSPVAAGTCRIASADILSAPARIISVDPRAPLRNSSESMRRDLPAPVSPCSREKATNVKNTTTSAVKNVATKVGDAFDVSAPIGGTPDNPQEREKQRFDQQWRDLQSFKAQQQAQQQAAE